MADELDVARLKTVTDDLIASISSPAFVDAMKKMKQTPINERLDYASKNLTPSVLSNAGVKFPQGMRITSRYFEPGSPDIIEVDDFGSRLRPVSSIGAMGAWGCACGGAATVCGGAGGGR